MKRRNVQLAFIGEGSPSEDVVDELITGDEAVEIAVTGGHLLVVVPAGTPDNLLAETASEMTGDLILEDGRRLSFEIKGEAVGAQFAINTAPDGEPHVGLSALGDIPGGV